MARPGQMRDSNRRQIPGMLTDRPTGNDIAGMNLLLALVNQVQGLINAGTLTAEEGQPLIDVANAIIDDFLAG